MSASAKLTTTVSTKGQVILPKAVREHRKWGAGTRLVVEETPEGVLLRTAPLFRPTTIEEVFGSLKYDGPVLTIEQMDEGVAVEARRRARD
jgi:AbrB family looped-hinge helix DNA binding protein